jgi:hypothetical protein
LAEAADASGAEKPPPAGDVVLPQCPVEDERPPFDIEVDIRLLEYPIDVYLVVCFEVLGQLDDGGALTAKPRGALR